MAQGMITKVVTADGIRWRVRVNMVDPQTGRRKRPQRTYKTRREAEAGKIAWLAEIERGTAVTTSKMTLASYLDYWLETVARHRVRPTTLASYTQIIHNRIVPTLGTVPVQKLTPAQVQALYGRLLENGRIDGRTRGLSPRSVKYAHTVLRMALQDALKLGLVPRNVCDAAMPPKAGRPQVQYWDSEDVRRFLDVAHEDRDRALWVLALHTGMRRGEVLGVRWQDLDLDRALLRVRQSLVQSGGVLGFQEPKTSSSRRTIALDETCVATLREQRNRQMVQRLEMGPLWHGQDLVFDTDLGMPLHPSNVNRRFVALIIRAGVPRIPFHGMRHTHATMLMKHGVNPKVVSERLGHATIAMTLSTYSHVLPQMQEQAAAIFAAAVGQN
jgi:integrase